MRLVTCRGFSAREFRGLPALAIHCKRINFCGQLLKERAIERRCLKCVLFSNFMSSSKLKKTLPGEARIGPGRSVLAIASSRARDGHDDERFGGMHLVKCIPPFSNFHLFMKGEMRCANERLCHSYSVRSHCLTSFGVSGEMNPYFILWAPYF